MAIIGYQRAAIAHAAATCGRPVYADTDCLVYTGRDPEGLTFGDGLGEYEHHAPVRFFAHSPKNYAYFDQSDGAVDLPAQGRIKASSLDRITSNLLSFDQYVSLREFDRQCVRLNPDTLGWETFTRRTHLS
jgi:hypothetical protein